MSHHGGDRALKLKPSCLKQALWQVPVLILLAGVAALGVNHFRPAGIPLSGDWSEAARFSDDRGESLLISLDQAKQGFDRDQALFLDARPVDQYLLGHIQGAVSLPFQDLDARLMEVMERLETGKILVAYCDGENCELSHDLALFLKDSGFDNARVLVNGWTLWREAGLPTEVGESRHE